MVEKVADVKNAKGKLKEFLAKQGTKSETYSEGLKIKKYGR